MPVTACDGGDHEYDAQRAQRGEAATKLLGSLITLVARGYRGHRAVNVLALAKGAEKPEWFLDLAALASFA
jgi:hypothetical protein